MARLPQSGADDNTWGEILNDFLSVSHNGDGTIKAAAIASKADDTTVVHNTADETIAGVKTFSASPIVPTPTDSTDAANKTYVDSTVAAGTPDADATTKGKIRLAGDIAGTANSPTVPGLASKANDSAVVHNTGNEAVGGVKTFTNDLNMSNNLIYGVADAVNSDHAVNKGQLDLKQPIDTDLTVIAGLSPTDNDVLQRKAGAWTNRTPAQLKTDLALSKTDVGLGNVDNTSDVNKPISTATQTALDTKASVAQAIAFAVAL